MANWDAVRQEWENSKITLKALAEKHDVKLGTLKSRKSREKWSRDATGKKDATKSKMVATSDKDAKNKATSKARKARSGNPNPVKQFTKRNQAARKHGLYAKYLTDTQKEIIDDFKDFTIADQLWLQIEIKFSAIIQLQKIMWVENAHDTLNEVSSNSDGQEGSSESYKVIYAYEQYEAYIKAQARAMAEYRNLVKHFMTLTHEDDERKLKLEYMQTNIDKAKAEAERIKQEQGQVVEDIVIVDAWSDDDD